MYICICNNVTDKDIAKAVEAGCHTLEALQQHTRLGTQCGSCKNDACALLKRFKADASASYLPAPAYFASPDKDVRSY